MESCPRCASLLPANVKACPVCGEPTGTQPGAFVRGPETIQTATSGGVTTVTPPETRRVTEWPAPPSAEPPGFQWSSRPQRKYGLAIASMVLGIVGLFLCPFLLSIAAIVTGIVALFRIRGSAGDLTGEGQAIAGIALGSVGLVTGIMLVAIAIPTFLGARNRAWDRQAQDSARNAATAAKVVFTDSATFEAATPDLLRTVEPSLKFVGGESLSTDAHTVSVLASPTDVVLATQSQSGTCWYLQVLTDSVGYARRKDAQGSCTAASATGGAPIENGWP